MIKKGFLRLLLILIFLFSAAEIYATQQTAEATQQTIGMSPILFLLILLIGCLAIGILAVLAGVGGGVIFTPVMMDFTPIDSFIVRATGLLVAMAGALVAARPFLRRGITNIKILFWSAVPYTVCCAIGALLAGYVKAFMGLKGEAFVRGALDLIVIGIGLLFIFAGKRIEYPEVENVDRFTERLGLAMAYWEDSLGKVVDYKVKHADIALILFSVVGLISGFFGLGAGWAMVPVLIW